MIDRNTLVVAAMLTFQSLRVLGFPCSPPDSPGPSRSSEDLAKLIGTIHPWSTSGTYSARSWDRLIKIAKIFQSSNLRSVSNAFLTFDRNNSDNAKPDYLEDSKPFLLLRVMFDVPEKAPIAQSPSMGWVSARSETTTNETANLAWPVLWRSGSPALAAPYRGYEGPQYQSARDYAFLASKFRFRDLTQYKTKKR